MKDQNKHLLKYVSGFIITFAATLVIVLGACLWFDWEPDFVVIPLLFTIVSSFTWIIAAIGEMKSKVKEKESREGNSPLPGRQNGWRQSLCLYKPRIIEVVALAKKGD